MLLAACGSNSGTVGQTPSCALTLTGDLTGSYDCRPATTFYSKSTNTSGFAFSIQQGGNLPAITVSIGWTGTPQKQAYRSTDPGAEGGLLITMGKATWSAAVSGAQGHGSYVLVLTTVAPAVEVSTGAGYVATGTLDATLPAESGSGSAGVHVVF